MYGLLGEVKNISCTVCLYVMKHMFKSIFVVCEHGNVLIWVIAHVRLSEEQHLFIFWAYDCERVLLQTALRMETVSASRCEKCLRKQQCCKRGVNRDHSSQ